MKLVILILTLIMAGSSFNLSAQTLLLNGISQEPGNNLAGVPRPNAGMTSQRVTEIFGQPGSKSTAVGTPPIERWFYKGFIVVLEDNRVIHSVVRKPEQEALADMQ